MDTLTHTIVSLPTGRAGLEQNSSLQTLKRKIQPLSHESLWGSVSTTVQGRGREAQNSVWFFPLSRDWARPPTPAPMRSSSEVACRCGVLRPAWFGSRFSPRLLSNLAFPPLQAPVGFSEKGPSGPADLQDPCSWALVACRQSARSSVTGPGRQLARMKTF